LFAAGEVLWMIVAADQAVVEEAIETLTGEPEDA
jgi:hypothetical protein